MNSTCWLVICKFTTALIFLCDISGFPILYWINFFKKNLEDRSLLCGATDTPVLVSLLGFKSRVGSLIHALQSHTYSLNFTFGVTPADLLASSMAAEPFSFMYLGRHWWGLKPGSIMSLLSQDVRPGSSQRYWLKLDILTKCYQYWYTDVT